MTDFLNIDYLSTGSHIQQRVYEVIMKHGLLARLHACTPVLAGTFPLGIDVPGSDLDILCEYHHMESFRESLVTLFGQEDVFSIREYDHIVVANFQIEEFPVEVFGQDIPVTEQFGYRHMVIEEKILLQRDAVFKDAVIALKKAGIKTEPAFAQLLGLEGDPYLALLELNTA